MDNLILLMVLIAGILIGVLHQRWVYYSKTGEHLQDLEKDKDAFNAP
jgi:hypothetical protein